MVIYYDEDHLKNRQETFLRDEKGNVLYRGIYDFSYKYRTRLFEDLSERAYVELDITSEYPRVVLCDPDGRKIGELIRKEGLYLDGDLFETLELLGADGKRVAASGAVLDGDSLILRSCGSAVTIRYARTPFFTAKLFNAAGIPAKPFETNV